MADVEEFRCFIGGLSWETSDKDLEAAFRRYGRIVEAKVVTDRETGRPRGFGFVTFDDEQGMDDAIDKMHGKELGGREITVSKAQPKSGGGSRGYGGGSGRGGRSSGGRGGGSNECFKCGETGHWARECPSGGGGGRDGYGSRGSDRGSDRGDRYGGSRSGGYESSRYSSDRRDDKYGSGGRSSYRDSGGRGSRSGPYDRPNGGSRSSRDDRY